MWPDERVAELVTRQFIPVRVHAREQAEEFSRLGLEYGAQWTPAILMLDPSGKEQHRVEGFVPADELLAQLEFGLGKIAFSSGEFEAAERRFRRIPREAPEADVAPEALYWAGVAKYRSTGDAGALEETAMAFHDRYQRTTWATKASVWEPE